ncbi:MAG: heavy metal-binding domain-containing protein [Candidatus Bathyarchaeota archaeon]|nr:heavy metal-binding domain-containing protein [Candidatus Termiticorpusculum sp.]
MKCPRCENIDNVGAVFCSRCGTKITDTTPFLVVTTPIIAGYKIKKVLGVVTGFTLRTRGILGQFMGGIESMVGGEVTAYSSEIEKARWEAIDRIKARATALGANAIIGLDVETSGIGQSSIVLFSATGTAVIIEPENLDETKSA